MVVIPRCDGCGRVSLKHNNGGCGHTFLHDIQRNSQGLSQGWIQEIQRGVAQIGVEAVSH